VKEDFSERGDSDWPEKRERKKEKGNMTAKLGQGIVSLGAASNQNRRGNPIPGWQFRRKERKERRKPNSLSQERYVAEKVSK
jgi:hypothetical protein